MKSSLVYLVPNSKVKLGQVVKLCATRCPLVNRIADSKKKEIYKRNKTAEKSKDYSVWLMKRGCSCPYL